MTGTVYQINGIGEVPESKILSILTDEDIEKLRNGELTEESVAMLYKIHCIREASEYGAYEGTFNYNLNRIPDELTERLSPKCLGKIIDVFYHNYNMGKNAAYDECVKGEKGADDNTGFPEEVTAEVSGDELKTLNDKLHQSYKAGYEDGMREY